MNQQTCPIDAGTGRGAASAAAAGPRAGSLRGKHLVFLAVAAAAPLSLIAGFAPLGLKLAGAALPVGFLVPGILYGLFAVGFTAMARHASGGGAFYAYITQGLGDVVGAGAAVLGYIGYLGCQVGFVVACGVFTASALNGLFGLSVPVFMCAMVISVLAAALGYRRVKVGAWVLGVLLSLELGTLAVFCLSVLIRGGREGLSLNGFAPSAFLTSGLASVFVLTFVAFIGFEQTTMYGEDVVDSRRTVPRATYVTIGLLTVAYTFCAWVIVQALGPSRLSDFHRDGASRLVFDLNSEFVGTVMTAVMQLLLVTSLFGGCLAMHNACSRYLLALGQVRILPKVLAKTSATTGTPSVAGITQAVLVSALIAAFAMTSADPYVQVVPWACSPAIVAVLTLQVLVSVAVIRFFSRGRYREGLWHRLIAPALAAVGLAVALVYVVVNLGYATGLSAAQNLMLLAPVLTVFVAGLLRGQWLRNHVAPEGDYGAQQLSEDGSL